MGSKITPNVDRIIDSVGLLEYYVCNWQLNQNISSDYFTKNISEFNVVKDNLYKGLESAVSSGAITKEEASKLDSRIKSPASSSQSPSEPPTPTSNVCYPPEITSISPTKGATGTIIQVTGKNLFTTNKITVNNQNVNMKLTQIFNNETLRFSVPVSSEQLPTTGKIKVFTEFGDVTSNIDFIHL
jgi:flagellar motor protein MotB